MWLLIFPDHDFSQQPCVAEPLLCCHQSPVLVTSHIIAAPPHNLVHPIEVPFLVCAAGASQHALAEETSPDVTKKLFDLNTVAPINLTQALLPHILAPSPHTQTPQSSFPRPQQPNSVSQQASSTKQTADGALHQRAEGGHEGGQRGCHIVVVGSMAGKVPAPGQAVYSACKTALVGYFSSLQSELADRYMLASEHCCSNGA